LNREYGFAAGQRPDEVAVVLLQLYVGGVFVGAYVHRLPPVVREPVMLRQRLAHRHHFYALLLAGAVDGGIVRLDECP